VNYQWALAKKKEESKEHRFWSTKSVLTFLGGLLSHEPPIDPAGVALVGFLIPDEQDDTLRFEVAWIKGLPPVGK
jgi:hypothetical protein